MKWLAALLLLLPLCAEAQQLVNCDTNTACSNGLPAGTGRGDTAAVAFSKVNANFNTMTPVFSLLNNRFLCNFSGSTAPAAACNHLVLSPSTTWSGDGVTAGNSTLFDGGTFTGTCTGHCYAHWYNTTWRVTNSGQAAQNLNVTTFLDNAAFTGGFVGLNSALNVSAATGNSSVSKIYQAGQITASTNVNDNGAPGTPMNSLFGLGVTCQIQTPAAGNSYWKGCGGIEMDLALQANTSANTIGGVSVILLASNAVAAANANDAFWVGAQPGATPTITTAYGMGSYLGVNALASTASVMRFNPTNGVGAGPTLAHGIDFAGLNAGVGAITFTGTAFNSTGFQVDGSGNETANSWTAGGTTFTVSGCGAAGSRTGGATAGSFTVGTGASPCTFTVTLPTAPHGWVCNVDDATSNTHIPATTGGDTTHCVVKGNATTSDLILFSAVGY